VAARSILAVELCLELDADLTARLHQLLKSGQGRVSLHHKWTMWDQAGRMLLAAQQKWQRGCWDFFEEDARARSDFNMWVHGMLSEEGARTTPSGTADAYRGGRRFMTFTMAALIVKGTACERQIAHLCDIPASQLWASASFARILSGIRFLNFAHVEGSTMYLIPRDPPFALTDDDLEHPKFHYLRPIA
jgi:hypothetical protein